MASQATISGGPVHVSRRAGLVAGLSAAVAAFIAYLVLEVPVAAPLPGGRLLLFCPLAPLPLPRAQIAQYGWAAAAAALVVAAADAVAVAVTLRHRRVAAVRAAPVLGRGGDSPLRLERVPVRAAAIAGGASLALLAAGFSQGYALWIPVGAALLPWLPLVALEAVWKYEHYGFWAIFGVVVLLQLGHMGEHTVQVLQLLIYDGRLAQAHGVFGQLDLETIHFVWDSAIWLTLCLVLTRFGRGNPWLWIAFGAASLHEVEHLYLYWIYTSDPWFYVHAGLAGIMGNGGLIGSPLARPYLHFAYNFVVVVPMVLAFLDQTKRMGRPRLKPRPAAGPGPRRFQPARRPGPGGGAAWPARWH